MLKIESKIYYYSVILEIDKNGQSLTYLSSLRVVLAIWVLISFAVNKLLTHTIKVNSRSEVVL